MTVATVGVVGCGWAGSRHAAAFRAEGVRVAWVVDTDPGRRRGLAERVGARPTGDLADVLGDPGVEAVSVCLPHDQHAPVTVAAVAAGKHVLCEKPLATTLADADRMVAAAERAGRVLMVGENVWFDPALLRARDLVASGSIGTVVAAHIVRDVWMTDEDLARRPWAGSADAAGGGIMIFGGVHDFEKARMLVGEVDAVSALAAPARTRMEGDDTSVAMVRFAGGAVGTLVESFSAITPGTASGAEVHRLRLDGTAGSLTVVSNGAGGIIEVFSAPGGRRDGAAAATHQVEPVDTFRAEVAHFVDCVRTGRQPVTSGRSGRRPLELVLAAYRSMRQAGAWQTTATTGEPSPAG